MRRSSSFSSSFGKERCWNSRTREGATGASQSATSQRVRRPMWVIWTMSAQPWRWMRSAKPWSTGTMRSSEMSIWPKADGLSGATVEEPPNIVSARPPFAFSSW